MFFLSTIYTLFRFLTSLSLSSSSSSNSLFSKYSFSLLVFISHTITPYAISYLPRAAFMLCPSITSSLISRLRLFSSYSSYLRTTYNVVSSLQPLSYLGEFTSNTLILNRKALSPITPVLIYVSMELFAFDIFVCSCIGNVVSPSVIIKRFTASILLGFLAVDSPFFFSLL